MGEPVTPTLVVVSGPPGSGKTTLAHKIAAAVGCPVISRDETAHEAAHRAFRRVNIAVPALEVDTSDGYRPPFGQILSFVTGTAEL